MEKIYVVVSHGEVDSAFTDLIKASMHVADLCKLEFDNVMYDANGFAESECGAVKMVAVWLQS